MHNRQSGHKNTAVARARSLSNLLKNEKPPFSLKPILDHFGIHTVIKRLLYSESARIVSDGGELIIELNSLFTDEAYHRFSIAHELGRLILNEAKGKPQFAISSCTPSEEARVGRLARELVIPLWAARNAREDCSLPPYRTTINSPIIRHIAKYFGVEEEVVRERFVRDLRLYKMQN